ncbi:MAG: thiamine pyrophosphate-binding protein [Acidobacteria bacterium]|nr:MAG: thiamine pyrophosphate-binding protein [Acidobacteriota bacterium]
MKQSARLFLDKKIGRRAFMGQLAQVGVASAAASRVTRTLSAATEDPGRVVHGMTGGELMAEFLLDWKVPYVFGLGGSEEVGFLDALVDRLELQYVQSLHEGSVMSMADGYARASGEIPIVNLHSVAGAGYAFAPMVNTFKDRIPVVITVGRQSTEIRGTNAFLEAVNLHQIPKDYTRWTWDVMAASTIPDVLRRAFLLATVPPGGPTFVTFSKDLWEEPVASAEIVPKARSGLDLELGPSDDLVKKACDLLTAADFPIITAGREVSRYGGVDELLRIAELIGAPLFKELHVAHCPHVVPSTHPHSVGMFTEDPSYPKDFDLYWSAGGTMFSLGALPKTPLVPRSAKVIHTGFDAAEIGRTYPVDVPMMANVQVAARAILEELESRDLNRTAITERRSKVVAYHHARRARLDRVVAEKWDEAPISCERLMKELSNKLEPDAIVVSELVTSEAYLSTYLEIDHTSSRRRRNLTSSGGVLGWGVAAAVGAKIAKPHQQVIALVGDGSFQFGPQALWSAVRYEVPIGIVIFRNGQYQANRKFLDAYGKRAAATGKYIGVSLDFPEIDNISIAKGYGVEGEHIEKPEALSAALDRCLGALADGRPYLLDVVIERHYGGADSEWHDFFSVARNEPRRS